MNFDKTVLVYASIHKKNTEKVVSYIRSRLGDKLKVINILTDNRPEFSNAECIIFDLVFITHLCMKQ